MTSPHRQLVLALAALSALLLAGAFALPFVSNSFKVALNGEDYRGLLANVEKTLERSRPQRQPRNVMDALAQGFRDAMGQKIESDIARQLRDPKVVAQLNTALQKYALERGGIRVGDHYLGRMIADLFRGGEWLVGTAVVLFSVVFPLAKVLGVLLVALGRVPTRLRPRIARAIDRLSKWSAGDVFIAALAVVFFKAKGFSYEFHTEAGLVCYFFAFVASAAASWLLLRGDGPANEATAPPAS